MTFRVTVVGVVVWDAEARWEYDTLAAEDSPRRTGVVGHISLSLYTFQRLKMSLDIAALDSHIDRLRKGETLTENEVRALCEKVRDTGPRRTRG